MNELSDDFGDRLRGRVGGGRRGGGGIRYRRSAGSFSDGGSRLGDGGLGNRRLGDGGSSDASDGLGDRCSVGSHSRLGDGGFGGGGLGDGGSVGGHSRLGDGGLGGGLGDGGSSWRLGNHRTVGPDETAFGHGVGQDVYKRQARIRGPSP